MNYHPFLRDPNSVLIYRHPLNGTAEWEDFRAAAHFAMSLMQIELDGESAVIKPNVTSGERFANPDSGITTHPGFVQGMAEHLRDHGARRDRISVIEDPRDVDNNLPRNWNGTGYELAAVRTGMRLLCPTTYTCVKKNVANPLVFRQLNVSRLAVDPHTVLFNVPKLKTHNLAITTLAMKNLMGLVNVFDRHFCAQAWNELPADIRSEHRPRQEWFTREMHELWQTNLATRLVDTAKVLRPALNIVEGVVGREGTGFQHGQNRPLGLIIAGINMVAVDSAASWLAGFDPLKLIYLNMASAAGLGENDPARLTIYTEQDGELIRCADADALRVDPPFRVISGILGENPDPFHASSPDPQNAANRDDKAHDPIFFTYSSRKESLPCHSTSENAVS